VTFGNPLDPLAGTFGAGAGTLSGDDLPEVRRLLATYESVSGPLLRAEFALGMHLFVVVPSVWALVGIATTWIYLLGGILVLQILTIVEFRAAFRIVTGVRDSSWWWKALPLLLAPPAATAAHLALTKPLFSGHHPVAVAAELCSDDDFRRLALARLRRLEYPLESERLAAPVSPGELDGPGSRAHQIDIVRRIVAERLGHEAARLADPARRSPAAESYCPRCLEEYAASQEVCSDCPGVVLKRFH
jgi:hypothetical protein